MYRTRCRTEVNPTTIESRPTDASAVGAAGGRYVGLPEPPRGAPRCPRCRAAARVWPGVRIELHILVKIQLYHNNKFSTNSQQSGPCQSPMQSPHSTRHSRATAGRTATSRRAAHTRRTKATADRSPVPAPVPTGTGQVTHTKGRLSTLDTDRGFEHRGGPALSHSQQRILTVHVFRQHDEGHPHQPPIWARLAPHHHCPMRPCVRAPPVRRGLMRVVRGIDRRMD